MNTDETVSRLREYISVARPAYADIRYQLLTTHPNKAIEDESLSLEQAKLANCVVVVKLEK
jgi:UBX domain-containing protein 1